jgi:hypothetical protein
MRMTSTVRHRLTTVVANADGKLICMCDDNERPHLLMKMEGGSTIKLLFTLEEIRALEQWTRNAPSKWKALVEVYLNKHSGGTV